MKTSDASNRPTSDTTSTSAPANSSASGPKAPPADEAAFLRKQEQDAKQAISRVLAGMTADLKTGADPRAWTREYPWLSLGAATVVGFVAVCVMVPTKEQSALNKLAAIERALHPSVDEVNGETNGHGKSEHALRSGSFIKGLGWQLFSALRPVLMSLITAGIAAKTAKETVQDGPGADGSAYPPS